MLVNIVLLADVELVWVFRLCWFQWLVWFSVWVGLGWWLLLGLGVRLAEVFLGRWRDTACRCEVGGWVDLGLFRVLVFLGVQVGVFGLFSGWLLLICGILGCLVLFCGWLWVLFLGL